MAHLHWAVLALGIAISGCYFLNPRHELTAEGESVVIVERRIELRDCLPLSTVQGHSSSIFHFDIRADIEVDARNQAGHHGGNRIIVKPSHELMRNADLSGIIYEVFYCRPVGSPPQPAPAEGGDRPAKDRIQ